MIILGIILLVIGYFTSIPLMYPIGGILLVLGVVFLVLARMGHPVGGRELWW